MKPSSSGASATTVTIEPATPSPTHSATTVPREPGGEPIERCAHGRIVLPPARSRRASHRHGGGRVAHEAPASGVPVQDQRHAVARQHRLQDGPVVRRQDDRHATRAEAAVQVAEELDHPARRGEHLQRRLAAHHLVAVREATGQVEHVARPQAVDVVADPRPHRAVEHLQPLLVVRVHVRRRLAARQHVRLPGVEHVALVAHRDLVGEEPRRRRLPRPEHGAAATRRPPRALQRRCHPLRQRPARSSPRARSPWPGTSDRSRRCAPAERP